MVAGGPNRVAPNVEATMMQIVLLGLNATLAILVLVAGGTKLVKNKQSLADSGMAWVEDFSPITLKLIAVAELLGAVGLVLPLATGIQPVLAPVAASGLLIILIGAVITHLRRRESAWLPFGLGVLSASSAALGFVLTA